MSDSDNDFLLPDNSGPRSGTTSTGDSRPTVGFGSTPTPVPGTAEPTPVGFPGQNNSDYASGLLAARRRGLQQQQQARTVSPTARRASPTVSQQSPSQTTLTTNTSVAFQQQSPTTQVGTQQVLPQSEPSSRVSSAVAQPAITSSTAADDALFRILNPPPLAPAARREPTPQPLMAAQETAPAAAATLLQAAPAVIPVVVDKDRIMVLRAELEAKKHTLAQIREREHAMQERVRAEKAKKSAELQSLEAQIKRQWEDFEREKDQLESQYRQLEESQEAHIRAERARIEAEETAKHAPQLAALQAKVKELQDEESVLRQRLQAASASKDVVHTALTNAVAIILEKVGALFASEDQPSETGSDRQQKSFPTLREWEDEIRQMVRAEIRTAFVSSASSAAESERNEFAKSFEEMLRFWRDAEEEEKHHVLKMDEQLMLDLQSMAHEDLDRLQREEHAIEELFMSSREQWMTHHTKVLHDELEATMTRRAKELEFQRSLRTEMHQRRMRAIEEDHQKQLEHAKAVHDGRMDLLRREQQMLERLHDAKVDMIKHVREEVSKANEGVLASADSLTTVLTRMKDLKLSLDEMRATLDRDRQKSLELREGTLSDVQGLIVAQATAVEQERTALGSALIKLEVTQAAVERQLELERNWVAETQAKVERSRSDWEREYRRWSHAAAQEKRNVEKRFSDVLTQLSEASAQLESEAQEVEVEGNTLRRACAARSASIAAEITAVETKETELADRQQQLLLLLADLEAKSRSLSAEWQHVLQERQELGVQRAELEREEGRLNMMSEQLAFMKRNIEQTHGDAQEAAQRGRMLSQQLEASREFAQDGVMRVKRRAEQLARQSERENFDSRRASGTLAGARDEKPQTSIPQSFDTRNPNRLPLQLLSEIRDSLRDAPRRHADPAMSTRAEDYHPTTTSLANRHRAPRTDGASEIDDATGGASTTYHFTNLVGVSDDGESTSVSQQTS